MITGSCEASQHGTKIAHPKLPVNPKEDATKTETNVIANVSHVTFINHALKSSNTHLTIWYGVLQQHERREYPVGGICAHVKKLTR